MKQRTSYVPVFVDNASYPRELAMTRFTYFYIELTEPNAITLSEYGRDLPVLLAGAQGVIVSGIGNAPLLDSPKTISELFGFIDESTPYTISADYIWLPNALLEKCIEKRLSRGDVVRVFAPLFLQAYTYVRTPERIRAEEVPPGVRAAYWSEEETAAFKEWTGQVVEQVKVRYRRDQTRNLRERRQRG